MQSRFPLLIALVIFIAGCGAPEISVDVPTSHYGVGSNTLFIHDETRGFDSVGGVPEGIRTLITEVWYPVAFESLATQEYREATYGDYVFGNETVHQLMMTQTSFKHLTPETVTGDVTQEAIDGAIQDLFHRTRKSFIGAPIALGSFPLVLMTHGDAGSRYNMESVAEYLASQGYIVIAPEHTGNSPYSMIGENPALNTHETYREAMLPILALLDENGVYAHEKEWGQTYIPLNDLSLKNLDLALLERVNDLRAVIKFIELEQIRDSAVFNSVDLDRIAVMGRSFGGGAALATASLIDEIDVAVAVAALTQPNLRHLVPKDQRPDEDDETVFLSDNGTVYDRFEKPTMLLLNAEDETIIPANLGLATLAGTQLPSLQNRNPQLKSAMEQSIAPVFMGELANSNHGSFTVAAGYWWPELKPNNASLVFMPLFQYELVDSYDTHQLQKRDVYFFLDRYLNNNINENGFEFDFDLNGYQVTYKH